jgi:hypothetical protein
MTNKIFKGYTDELNSSKINIHDMKELETKSYLAYISFGENNKPLIIQTPEMHIPYAFGGNYNGQLIHTLNFSFGDFNSNEKLGIFHNNMLNIDKKIKAHALENHVKWFPKTANKTIELVKDVIENNYQPIVKQSIDKNTKKVSDKYPPTFKVKIQYDEETKLYLNIDVCDSNDTNIKYDFNEIKDKLIRSKAKLIYRITGIWLIPATGMFGVTAKASLLKVSFPNDVKDMWRSDSDDDDNDSETIEYKLEQIAIMKDAEEEILNAKLSLITNEIVDSEEDETDDELNKKPVAVSVNDDEDDDDEDDDDEDVKPIVRNSKKVVVKKKSSK